MIRKKRGDDTVGFQLGPMIDITFLLLIFLMVTTKITQDQIKLDVKLPVASNSVVPSNLSQRVHLSIDSAGNYFIGDRLATKEEMLVYLKDRFKNYPPLRLYIRADQAARGEKISEIMSLAAEAGALDVIFGSYQNP